MTVQLKQTNLLHLVASRLAEKCLSLDLYRVLSNVDTVAYDKFTPRSPHNRNWSGSQERKSRNMVSQGKDLLDG